MKKYLLPIISIIILLLTGCEYSVNSSKVFEKEEPRGRLYEILEEKELFVDLSSWQEDINFDIFEKANVKGVILRLARYNLDVDKCFDKFYNEAKKRGLKVGAYYFMNATNSETASEDADKVIKLLKDNDYKLDLPFFYDIENDETNDNANNLKFNGRLKNAATIKTFCDKLIEAGYDAGYYCNTNFAKYYISSWQLEKYPFWLAKYNSDDFNPLENYSNVCMWQFTNKGRLEGFDEDLDFDWVYVDFQKKL